MSCANKQKKKKAFWCETEALCTFFLSKLFYFCHILLVVWVNRIHFPFKFEGLKQTV